MGICDSDLVLRHLFTSKHRPLVEIPGPTLNSLTADNEGKLSGVPRQGAVKVTLFFK